MQKLASEIKKTLAIVLGSGTAAYVGGPGAGLAGAAAAIAAPYAASRLVADKNFVNLARQYALARQAKNEKVATRILNKMLPITEAAVKLQLGKNREETQGKQ
jgi:hypothetical protein